MDADATLASFNDPISMRPERDRTGMEVEYPVLGPFI